MLHSEYWCNGIETGVTNWRLVLRSEYWCNGVETGVTNWRLVLWTEHWYYRVESGVTEWRPVLLSGNLCNGVDTDPEAVEVGVGVVVGLVVCLHQ